MDANIRTDISSEPIRLEESTLAAGWRSYLLPFSTEEEKNKILDSIIRHDNCDDWNKVGKTLCGVVIAKFKEKNVFKNFKYCILCGHSNASNSTFEWFENEGFDVELFNTYWEESVTYTYKTGVMENYKESKAKTTHEN